MDKQKRQAIRQMILATLMCAAVVISGMVMVEAGTQKEQAEIREQTAPKAVAVAPKAVKEPVLKYWDSIPLDAHLQNYIVETSDTYGIAPEIVMAMIERESEFDSTNIGDEGNAYGLMQIWPKWHYARMQSLGCTDLLDPYHNVTVGIDYLAELANKYGDVGKALVGYNSGAYRGVITDYAKQVLSTAEKLREQKNEY